MRLVRIVAASICWVILASSSAGAQVFREDFDGSTLNPGIWQIEPGSGQVVVHDGVVTVSGPGPVFPVVTSIQDPFPTGDFVLRVGMQYLSQGHCGDGFGAMDNFWEDYFGTACRPFLLWQDGGGVYVYTGSSGPAVIASPPETAYHIYEWSYTAGEYVFSLDGVIRATGNCAPHATKVFFGHPHPIQCDAPWTTFSIDFIEIIPTGPTRTNTASWGTLKQIYR